MTNQELFDKVSRHLLTQNARSISSRGVCLYRGPNRTKCAIGCLIPEENYSPTLEGKTVCNIEVMLVAGIRSDQQDLATKLQKIHDVRLIEDWKYYLSNVAKEFKLEFKELS